MITVNGHASRPHEGLDPEAVLAPFLDDWVRVVSFNRQHTLLQYVILPTFCFLYSRALAISANMRANMSAAKDEEWIRCGVNPEEFEKERKLK